MQFLKGITVFVGCSFAARYPEGGGNFSVPLQWAHGLKRLGADVVWLEVLTASKEGPERDRVCITTFARRMRQFGLQDRWCLLYQNPARDAQTLSDFTAHGMTMQVLKDRLAGPNVLLNLSHCIHSPLLLSFERRIFCDLDPGEIQYWMTQLDMGQKEHHEFRTIGLNINAPDCTMPKVPGISWKTFFPLVDTTLVQPRPKPPIMRFTTIGQWYWNGMIEVNGEYPDLCKKTQFEPYLSLPRSLPAIRWELAMNIALDDPERQRLTELGWQLKDPHRIATSPLRYYRYLASATAEFTVTKGVAPLWRTGWISDRAAAFLATGRPVITEDAAEHPYLPAASGILPFHDLASATEAADRVLKDWKTLSVQARHCAMEVFDAPKVLRKILLDE